MLFAYWVTAFLSGAGVLVVEMTAPRALAPWFGQAQFVWTNVIGLVLAALAIGSMVGGRLADRRQSPILLASLLLAAATLVAVSAWLPGPVARAVLPARLPLEAAYPFLQRGSFLATLICFVPPVLLLGAVPPFLVRCAATRIEGLGRMSGMLYGAATLGSIAGSFATNDLLYERFGTRGTLLLAAGLIAMAALPLLFAARRARAAGAAAATIPFLLLMLPESRAAPEGAAFGELVAAVDSRYQHLEIRRRDDLGVGARVLAIDEGHDSFQSLTPAEGVLTGGLYYDYVNLLALDSICDGRLRVAILGLGAGTHARQLLALVGPRCRLTISGVELDPGVVALGRAHLDLPTDPRLTIWTDLDARTFVDHSLATFDLILVDCYARQSFVPPHVASREFFSAARSRLARGGTLALNVFGYGAHDPVSEAVAATLATQFDEGVVVASLPRTSNQLVWGRYGAPLRTPATWDSGGWPDELVGLAAKLATPGQWFRRRHRAADRIVRDDDGWFDALQEARLKARAECMLRSGGAPP
ncbi:MAG: hypothetical protein EXS13_10265 [Planctomycetes bacterium]|nr:hypothetical protein [Planctomycetota bacterium]